MAITGIYKGELSSISQSFHPMDPVDMYVDNSLPVPVVRICEFPNYTNESRRGVHMRIMMLAICEGVRGQRLYPRKLMRLVVILEKLP